jgi:hypothetical protein
MLFVDRDRIGPVAFARLERDGLIHDVLGPWGLPADIASTRALRDRRLLPLIPHNAWLTGLAALWLYGHANAPAVLDLVAKRGAHRILPSAGSPPLRLHAGSLLGLPGAGSPRVVSVTRACLDSLWHCETSTALLATASALRAKATSVEALLAMVDEFDVRTAGRRRVRSLVEGFA